jgi:hypothetical protein
LHGATKEKVEEERKIMAHPGEKKDEMRILNGDFFR